MRRRSCSAATGVRGTHLQLRGPCSSTLTRGYLTVGAGWTASLLRARCLAVCASPHLQEAGIPRKLAPTIGIAVDHRRRNRSLESLQVHWFELLLGLCVRSALACAAGRPGVWWPATVERKPVR
jgi:hypothetical protein